MSAFGFGSAQNIKPRIKWDAKADKMFRVDRKETESGWENDSVDITKSCAFLLNINSACFGWVDFSNGSVQEILVPYTDGAQPPPKPAWEQARPTVEFQVKLSAESGGDIRRFASSAMSVINTLATLRATVVAAPEYKDGKVPAIQLVGSEAIKSKYGTNYTPTFKVVSWHDAPEDFEGAEALARGSDAPAPAPDAAEEDPDNLPFDPTPAATPAATQGVATF